MKLITFNKISYLLEKIALMLGGFRFRMINDTGHYKGPGMEEYKPFCKGGHTQREDAIILKSDLSNTYTFTDDYEMVFFIGKRPNSTPSSFTIKMPLVNPSYSRTLFNGFSKYYSYDKLQIDLASATNVRKGWQVTTTATNGFYIYAIPKTDSIRVNYSKVEQVTNYNYSGGSGSTDWRSSYYDGTRFITLTTLEPWTAYSDVNKSSNQIEVLAVMADDSTMNNKNITGYYNNDEISPLFYERSFGRTNFFFVVTHPRMNDAIRLTLPDENTLKTQNLTYLFQFHYYGDAAVL